MTDREKRKAQRQAKREERRKNRKPFNETGVGKFLEQAGSTILESLGEIIPDKGVFAVVKDLIIKDEALSEKDREIALFLLEMDSKEMEEITKRLQSDNEHTITRLVRPVSYSLFLILFFVLVFLLIVLSLVSLLVLLLILITLLLIVLALIVSLLVLLVILVLLV